MIKNSKKTLKKDLNFGQILGINIISTTTSEVLTRVNYYLSHSIKFSIVTPNPELVLMAQANPELKNALNAAELPVPDGSGLNLASKFLFGKTLNIIHGRVLFMGLLGEADKNGRKVFLLGGQGGEAEMAAHKLKERFKKLRIESTQGPKLTLSAIPASEVDKRLSKDAVDRINKFSPDLLFVAFGNPKQEIWINKNLEKLNIKGAMAVGGTFRYIAGLSKLPPQFVETFEIEWLWRLLTEPKRIKRVFNAVIVFPLKVFVAKFSK